MKRIYIAFIIVFLASCGLFEKGAEIPESKTPDIEVLTETGTPDGTRGVLVIEPDDNEITEELLCNYETIEYKVGPVTVHEQIVKGIYTKINKTFTRDVNTWLAFQVSQSEYAFVQEATLYSVAGDSLDFINWAFIYAVGEETPAMWAGDLTGFSHEFNFDGTKNLKDYVTENNKVSFEGNVRGKSPTVDTYLELNIQFLLLNNCE